MLDIIGLRDVDVEVYAAFAGARPRTLTELSGETGLSSQRLTPILRGLVEKGLLTRFPGTPRTYAPIRPEIAIEALLRRKDQELAGARLVADQLRDRFGAAGGRRPADLVEVVSGNDLIAERADQLLRSARHEVVFVDKPPYAQSPSVLHPAERDLLARRVRFRGIYDRTALELHDLSSDLEAGLALGEEARVVTGAPLKLIVVDGKIGLVPLRSDQPMVGAALVVHPSTLLDALISLFGCLWRDGLPLRLPGSEGQAPDAVPVEDARLLALLTTGMPDRSIAKQLGLSYRTYQRRLRELMAALGAHTRFQAGLRAAARGWVTLPETQPPRGNQVTASPSGQ